MKKFKNILSIACLLLFMASCKKSENLDVQQPLGLGGDALGTSAIDKWIQDSLTTPYNISALYKWNPWNASLYKTVTPADESRVIPLFSALKRVWIDPYNLETGSDLFMKKYSPKQFVLIGSVEYDYYSVTLGQAEGGNNIVFFDVNQNFDKDPVTSIKRVIHTAHHEFGHILHQTVAYPVDFKGTSSNLGLPGYTSTWFNVSDADALSYGYATSYAMSGPDDDFVETIATMLTEGKGKWEELKTATNATARQALQQKEDFVVTYFRQVWNIDFYSLQARVQTALNALYPPPAVVDVYGYNKDFTSGQYGTATAFYTFPSFVQFPSSAAFTTLFNTVKANFAAEPTSLSFRSFEVYFNSPTSIQIFAYYNANNATANAAAPTAYGLYQYSMTRDAAGVYTFTYFGANTNGNARKASMQPLLDYFSASKFTIDWYEDPSVTYFPKVKFTPVSTPTSWFVVALAP